MRVSNNMCSSLESTKMYIPSYLEYILPLRGSLAEELAFIYIYTGEYKISVPEWNSDMTKMSQNTNSHKNPTKNGTKYKTSIVSL